MHHKVQEKGRFEVFEDYHLRVGGITADTEVPKGHTLREQRLDETETGEGKVATISGLSPLGGEKSASTDLASDLGLPKTGCNGIVGQEVFESIYNPGKLLLLVFWKNEVPAECWKPKPVAAGELRHRCVRIIRDYGMTDRREAPQYYPPVQAADD